MLISYSKKFNVSTLRKVCKIKCIKFTSHFNKLKLIKILNEFNAVKIIQQYFRRKTIIDNYCPISHEKLKYPFISIKVNNKFFYYDFYTLVAYLNKSQDFREPCTRQLISDNKLLEINKLIRYYYGKNSSKILISKSMIKNTDLNIIIYCLYDIINEMQNREILLEDIYSNILPRFIYYVNYLMNNHSHEDSQIILNACKEAVTNRIILDYIRLVEIINY